MNPTLTIAMACYRSFNSVYFTALALRAMHGWDFDLLAIDNAPESCGRTKAIIANCGGTYVHRPDLSGTSRPRNACFDYAKTPWVMVVDDHVILDQGAVAAAITYAERHPNSRDIISGPILGDDGRWTASHWASGYPHNMWGTWAGMSEFSHRWGNINEQGWSRGAARAAVDRMEPFEIPAMGLGLWMMRKEAWPGFNPHFRGFGGEEGYIHNKVRAVGGKAICHPRIRWHHKFRSGGGPDEVSYPLNLESHVRNLLLAGRELGYSGHLELGFDYVQDVWNDFGKRLNGGRGSFDQILADVNARQADGELQLRKKLNILGVWYTNNGAPVPLMQKSLDTIRKAKESSVYDVVVGACSWAPIPNNPFPTAYAGEDIKKLPGHHAIIKQIDNAWRVAEASRKDWVPDVVCHLEHDVLYPPGYFDRIGDAFAAHPNADVVSHLDYIGLNATGWLNVKERHEPLHQLAMRAARAKENLQRAAGECERQGWAYLEPDHARDRRWWVRIPYEGFAPSVHVNW